MGTTPADAYNYDVFEPAPYIEAGCDGPRAGEALGDEASGPSTDSVSGSGS